MSETITLDAAEYARQQKLLGLFDQVFKDEKVGRSVRHRVKEIDPSVNIPDDHPVAKEAMSEISSLREQLEGLRKERDDEKAARANADHEQKLRSGLGEAQSRYKLTDEGMDGVIKLMQDRQIADPLAAAALYKDSLPKPAPISGTTFSFDSRPAPLGDASRDEAALTKLWKGDETGFFADVVNDVMANAA
jgi:uncharacterized protein (UPF0147 family)